MKEKLEEALKKAIKKASRSPAPPKLAAAMDYAIFPGGARDGLSSALLFLMRVG